MLQAPRGTKKGAPMGKGGKEAHAPNAGDKVKWHVFTGGSSTVSVGGAKDYKFDDV